MDLIVCSTLIRLVDSDDQSSTSNMATANLIGSVLRNFQRPSWCDASTPRTQSREELVQIPRRQFGQLIQKQDILSQKIDHVIALLCQTPSAAQQPQQSSRCLLPTFQNFTHHQFNSHYHLLPALQ